MQYLFSPVHKARAERLRALESSLAEEEHRQALLQEELNGKQANFEAHQKKMRDLLEEEKQSLETDYAKRLKGLAEREQAHKAKLAEFREIVANYRKYEADSQRLATVVEEREALRKRAAVHEHQIADLTGDRQVLRSQVEILQRTIQILSNGAEPAKPATQQEGDSIAEQVPQRGRDVTEG